MICAKWESIIIAAVLIILTVMRSETVALFGLNDLIILFMHVFCIFFGRLRKVENEFFLNNLSYFNDAGVISIVFNNFTNSFFIEFWVQPVS